MSERIEPGRILGNRFRLERLIGVGTMGEVFEALDEKLGVRAAVKVLRHECLEEPEWKERFRREAQIAQTIDSPYVARVLRAGTSASARRPWIAFELVTGEALDVHLRRHGQPAFGDVEWMIADLLQGLEAVHAARIVHRDIKPANLQIERGRKRLRILDFGIAKLSREGAIQTSGLTRMENKLGTPSFMSPEQTNNAKDVDARADLYSAGCVAFLLLAGRHPVFDASAAAPSSLARASGVTWPVEMQGWVDQMIAPRRDARFSSALAALEAWKGASEAMHGFVAGPASTRDRSSPLSSRDDLRADTDVSPPSSR